MAKNIIITATVFSRPEIYKQVLESYENVRGLSCYTYMPIFEYNFSQECLNELNSRLGLFKSVYPVFNRTKAGVNKNQYIALQNGFEAYQADAIIHAEDDLLWAPDTLEYLLWGIETYEDDSEVFTISAHNSYGRENTLSSLNKDKSLNVKRRQKFTPWVWATWKNRWEQSIKPYNNFIQDPRGWDFVMNYKARKNMNEIYPMWSRVKHIGVQGVHVHGQEWALQEAKRPTWSNSLNIDSSNMIEDIQ